jgi:hypothetical protein
MTPACSILGVPQGERRRPFDGLPRAEEIRALFTTLKVATAA